MKKVLSVIVFSCTMLGVSSTQACGNWWATFLEENSDTFNYLLIEGQEYFKSVVKTTIKSLVILYEEYPDAFNKFIQVCLSDNNNPLPNQILQILMKFNLVQSNATISSTIKNIVSMVVENLQDGSVKIWTVDELIKDNWISTL